MNKRFSGNLLIRSILTGLFAAQLMSLSSCNDDNGAASTLSSNNQSPDPVVQDFPVFYVERPFVINMDGDTVANNQRALTVFEPGASLKMKARALPSATAMNLTDEVFTDSAGNVALYDVRDLAPDYAGERLLFSMRGPFDPDADEDEQPSWNIWEYDLSNDTLRRIISSDTTAEAGQDREPQYLPDGKIVFTSNRQRTARAILLDEGRPQFAALDEDRNQEAFVLHVMNDDGSDIAQITFNQSHDRDPVVMPDGKLVFNRWDNVPGRDVISLYRSNIDGTDLERYYGYHSQDSGRDGTNIVFANPRPLSDGRLLVLAQNNEDGPVGGDLVIIDTENFVESEQPTFNSATTIAVAQSSPLTDIVSITEISERGRFASVWPLEDGTGRLLISWSQCRLLETNTNVANAASTVNNERIVPCTPERLADETTPPVEATPLYGLWILDPGNDLQQPVNTPEEGTMISEAVVVSPRTTPFFQGRTIDDDTQTLINENVGVLHIRSLYDLDGVDLAIPDFRTAANPVLTPSAQRGALFMRLIKPVSLPDDELIDLPGTAFGRSQNELMREILGYATVHPDGSVLVKVPANVPFTVSFTNGNGERVTPRHRNWLQVRPGEVKQCSGCHTTDSELPHGRVDAEAPSINTGGPFSGLATNFLVDPGNTMAEAFALSNGAPKPQTDLNFDDIWTDITQRTADASFALRYQDLSTSAPINSACAPTWQSNCRITIHYETAIHPIWSVDREIIDADGVTVLQDFTCTACHSNTDAMGMAQVPVAQLDLSDGASSDQADHFKSYRELFFNDNELVLDNGVLVDRTEPAFDNNGNPIFELDENGELILDADGNPIPVLRTFRVAPTLNTSGAINSANFFNRFRAGGTHAGYLTPAELKLVAEWIDIGGQYYNDPFVVPQ
jgi:Tol biopolymer transport system component